MGGGVGVGCHASHRIVCESSQIAMPECGIGLVPDVGGSMLLAHAPSRLGEYYGLTSARMSAGDAILDWVCRSFRALSVMGSAQVDTSPKRGCRRGQDVLCAQRLRPLLQSIWSKSRAISAAKALVISAQTCARTRLSLRHMR